MIQKIWKVKPQDKELQDKLARELGISAVLTQLLMNRDIRTSAQADAFMRSSLGDLHDPYLLKDMDKAVNRIRLAVSKKELILIYGDYDADGITSVALLSFTLKSLGAQVITHIPHRVDEGYGVHDEAIKAAGRKKVSLIITVDCGISACEQVELAKSLGIDCIITDHHEIHGPVPDALAVINPLQADCSYPFKHLAGVGIAYKLASALTKNADEHLDLAAIGTVADVVPLLGENRIIVKHGLLKLKDTKKAGLRAMLDVSGLSKKDLVSSHIGFIIGPRINAAGRIGSPDMALKLLTTDDAAEADTIARTLDAENRSRQRIEEDILQDALRKIESEVNFKHHKVIVLHGDDWHEGVIGVVASKLVDRFYRPAILISGSKDVCKGSGRSTDGFHLFDAISKCEGLLVRFGGHEAACGISIRKDRIADFRDSINKAASSAIGSEDMMPVVDIDMDIPLHELSRELIAQIEGLGPFGLGNPRPVLASYDLELRGRPVNIGKNGFKFWVTDKKITCEAVEFRRRERIQCVSSGNKVSIAYTPTLSTWQGISSIQLTLEDIKEE